MSTNELLLLGLLGLHRMHGYELNDFLERQLGFVSELKKPTAYRLLDVLRDQGLVECEVERPGRRPERRVYHLTATGSERFLFLLRAELEESHLPVYPSNVALLFADKLPADERSRLLARRREALERQRSRLSELVARHPAGTTARLILGHDLLHLDVELQWLLEAGARLDEIHVAIENQAVGREDSSREPTRDQAAGGSPADEDEHLT